MFCALGSILLLLLASPDLLLNEVLYDPPGSDGGQEFVELLCPGPTPCDLGGVRLEFVNGSDPTRAQLLWSGDASRQLQPGQRWLLAEEQVAGADVTLALAIQNGPDALRLWRDELLLDAVAWGAVDGLGEGAAAPDVSSVALARVPDGIDTDDNARDFSARPPTPGQPNSYAHALQLLSAESVPAWSPEARVVGIELRIRFVGDLPLQEALLCLVLDQEEEACVELKGGPAEELRFERSVYLSAGPHELAVRSASASGHADSLGLPLQIGLGRLALSELLPAPKPPEPEWIELRAREDPSGRWEITDDGASPREFVLEAGLAENALVLLSEDCPALVAFRGVPDSVPCLELSGGWIALNNTASAAGQYADRVRLIDGRGAIVDEFAYGANAAVATGRSYERSSRSGAWLVSPSEPTPGLSNEVERARLPLSGLALSPEILTPDGDGHDDVLHVVLRPGEPITRVQSSIVDLSGETVASLGAAVADGVYLRWTWAGLDERGKPVPWGAYVVVVRAQSLDGEVRRWRSLFALGRRS